MNIKIIIGIITIIILILVLKINREFFESKILEPNIYFFSYINGNECKLFYFFIKYYISLGIKPENMLIVINMNTYNNSNKYIIKILKKLNIKFKISRTYNSSIKRKYVNSFLKTIPLNSWFVYPDLDEFFNYETNNIYNFINKLEKNKLQGATSIFNNRISSNNEIKDISLKKNIFKQFPKVIVDNNNSLSNGLKYDQSKIIIFKKINNEIIYTSSHTLNHKIKFDKKIYKNNHFKFTKYTIDNIKQKINNYSKLNDPSEKYKIEFYNNQLNLFNKYNGKYYLKN